MLLHPSMGTSIRFQDPFWYLELNITVDETCKFEQNEHVTRHVCLALASITQLLVDPHNFTC